MDRRTFISGLAGALGAAVVGRGADSPYPPLELPKPGVEPIWWPINAAQQAAINSRAEILLMGGQSGGGKTHFLAADACQEYRNPALRALLIRTTLEEMQELEDLQKQMYEPRGARWSSKRRAWVFPAGGIVRPGYLAHDKHLKRYQGNPYSWLGIDESGQHPENRVRKLVAWLAAPTHAQLRVRARFTSNPGDIGHAWQMQVFLRNRCPYHFPASRADDRPRDTSVYPGKVYSGARWTDGGLVHKTTSFIPAKLEDNPMYDDAKRASLMSQTTALRLQLLYGCWCNAEGLYFDFMRPDQVVPYPSIGDSWWWNHFISMDYGFGNSAAAVGMYAISPNGIIFKTHERTERKMQSEAFSKAICKDGFPSNKDEQMPAAGNWVETKMRPRDPERRRILFLVCDSAMDQHTGTGKSNYDLVQGVFNSFGVPCIKSSKDPMGNAQALYGGLENKGLILTSTAPRTYASLSSRVIDDRKAVKKIHGDALDDIYDETAYGYNTYVESSVKPEQTALDDEIARLRKEGMDETSLARLRWLKEQALKDKQAEAARGINLGRRPVPRKPSR